VVVILLFCEGENFYWGSAGQPSGHESQINEKKVCELYYK